MGKLYKNYLYLVPVLFFATMLILGATAHSLWADEAETVFFARTILQTGLPVGFDGVNMSAVNHGVLLNSDLVNSASPWLQFYVVATAFLIFGESAFVARLPFIILSIVSIFLIYKVTFKLTQNTFASFLAVLLSSLCVQLILFSYQARYYPLTILAGLIMFYSLLLESKFKSKILFILGGVIFIYSHYLSYAFFYLSLSAAFFTIKLINKESLVKISKFTISQFLMGLSILLSFIPWYLSFKPETNAKFYPFSIPDLINVFPAWFVGTFQYFNTNNVFPYAFLGLAGVAFYLKRKQKKEWTKLLLVFLIPLFYLVFLALFASLVFPNFVILSHLRYHSVLIPVFLILIASCLFEIYKVQRLVFLGIILLFIITNIFTFQSFKSYLFDYMVEITRPYSSADDLVADYLNKNAKEGETVWISIDRSHDPLIFLTDSKFRFVNRISPLTRKFFVKDNELPKYLYNFQEDPDWVILYSKINLIPTFYNFDTRPMIPLGREKGYDLKNDYVETIIPIFYGSDIYRPEMDWRQFKKPDPSYNEQVFIYRKKN